MEHRTTSRPVTRVSVNAASAEGPLELWRHALGHGGVNSLPLPDRVVEGVRLLRPRLIRVFLQEFFAIYPGNGEFDWRKLDPYMDALARTGAKVVAAITIKPKALFPPAQPAQWRPRDVGEWQNVIRQLVRRYSVERPIVTHWEIGNETDIGEWGGCPYLIPNPDDYGEYYAMTIRPILDAFPQAKVGGPAAASIYNDVFAGFIRYCRRTGAQLDFVSWHCYDSSPGVQVDLVRYGRTLLADFPGERPEMLLTEWNRRLGPEPSIEDEAFAPRRAATVAACILAMLNARMDWTFYYHVWDQMCFPQEFAPFATPQGVQVMTHHWNEVPHRLGLFGVCGEVRPQYFVYRMLSGLGPERIAARSDSDVSVVAGQSDAAVSVLAVNHSIEEQGDRVADLHFAGLRPGLKRLTVFRVDGARRWNPETFELQPVETRDVWAGPEFQCQALLAADSVALVRLSDAQRQGGGER